MDLLTTGRTPLIPQQGKLSKGTKLTTKLLVPFGAKIENNKAHYHLVCEAAQLLWSKFAMVQYNNS